MMTSIAEISVAISRFTPIAVSTCITTISRISVDTLDRTNFGASDNIGALLLNTNLRLVKYAKMTPAVQLITLNTMFWKGVGYIVLSNNRKFARNFAAQDTTVVSPPTIRYAMISSYLIHSAFIFSTILFLISLCLK